MPMTPIPSGLSSATADVPFLSVIVPAHRCVDMLRECLAGLVASDLPRDQWELIVVDDGSRDGTAEVARQIADRILTTSNGPRGPGLARNLGATHARGDVLVFIDSDVVVSRDALSRFHRIFAERRDVGAAFGAYDTTPRDPGFVSQYRNLLHHYVHRMNPGDAQTFWAGCGAVRTHAFLSVGGYDTDAYPRPQIEDIDLGYRLAEVGIRLVLDPEIQGTHLKRWTLRRMLLTDLRDRAIPWMYLLLDRSAAAGHGPLNLRFTDKLYTVLTGLACLCLLAALLSRDLRWLVLGGVLLLLVAMGNLPLFAWFARIRGPVFAFGVVPLRFLFYMISGMGAAWAIATYRLRPLRRPVASLRAASDRAVA